MKGVYPTMFPSGLNLQVADVGGAVFWVALMAIPLVSIVGGVAAAIVRTVTRSRLIELAQRERIAAIERGIDPAKLPPLPPETDREWALRSPADNSRRRAQSLMIGGIITLAIGVSMGFLMRIVEPGKDEWAVGIVPSAVGVALLLCALLVRPRQSGVK